MIRLIIAGSRTFHDYGLLCRKLDAILANTTEEIVVISGCAPGADTLGERWAAEHGHTIAQRPANWNLYGRRAGFLRNAQMAQMATHCVVFWDGKSPGTKHMIALAQKHGLGLRVVRY
jgi:hypothetical protein